jgi:hypothetical protein
MGRLDDVPAWPVSDERTPPHSAEAENGLLGSLLLDNACVAVVGDLLDEQSFYTYEARMTFAAVMALLKERQPADLVTVYEQLQRQGIAEEVGGLRFLGALEQGVASSRNARRYAEIIAEKAAERALIAGADEVARISWSQEMPFADRMEHIASVLARVEQQRKGPGRRVPVLRLDALRQASQAVRWTVKHVIPAASIGMLFGGSGTFKSFLALDAALHVVHGLPWMGRITASGPVLYIAAEGGAGLWGRIDAWHRSRNLKWQNAPLYVVPTAVDLTVDAWRVVDAAQAVGVCPAMVIVDTLSQTYSGEENSANEMAAYLREIGLRFRQLWNCSVLLVHHTGHQATERPRGSSSIRANIDFLMGVFRDEREMLATVSCVKQKDGELFKDAVFSLSVAKLGQDEDGDEITSLVARHLGTDGEVLEARQSEAEAGRGGRTHALIALVMNGMPEKELRRAFYETLAGLDADAKKKAYYRARDRAIRDEQIEVAEGFIIDRRKGA